MANRTVQIFLATETEWRIANRLIPKLYPENHCIDKMAISISYQYFDLKVIYLGLMGNVNSSLETYMASLRDNSGFVIAAGICAGIDISLSQCGDVLVGDTVTYYEVEKINLDSVERRHKKYSSMLCDDIFARIKKVRSEITEEYHPDFKRGESFDYEVHLKCEYASGEKVINSQKAVSRLLNGNGALKAIDMETAGIAFACEKTFTKFIYMKAVSDDGVNKGDKWQEYAAATSIATALQFCNKIDKKTLEYLCEPLEVNMPIEAYDCIGYYIKLASKMLSNNGYDGDYRCKDNNLHEIVTLGDVTIQKYLIKKIKSIGEKEDGTGVRLFNMHTFHAEENQSNDPINDRDKYFIIDPIDGTMNYKDGRPEYCISVAEYSKDQLKYGAIYMHIRRMLITVKDKQLYVNCFSWKAKRKIPVSKEDYVVAVPGDIYKLKDKKDYDTIIKVTNNFGVIRITGALAYDLGALALGEIDARISFNAKVEDVAAGVFLIEETGGKVTDIFGKSWTKNSCTIIAARNETIHKNILMAMETARTDS